MSITHSIGRLGLAQRLGLRLRAALPSPLAALAGAIGWGLLMATSALFTLWLHDWQTPAFYRTIGILFALGGALAFPFALYTARLFALGRSREVAFAAAFLAFAIVTIGATALIFAFYYRSYYAQWHAAAFTVTWTFQLVFTLGGAVAQFAVLGTRLYFPLGFLALAAISAWFAVKMR